MSPSPFPTTTDLVMAGVFTCVKNMTIGGSGLTQSVISRRLLNPFRHTEAEIKSVTDLAIIVAFWRKPLAPERRMDRELNEPEGNTTIHLKE